MTEPATLQAHGDGSFALSGDLVFDHVARVLGQGDAAFGGCSRAEVDLAQVGRVDSAGLALLLEWSIVAREAGRSVNYRNLPPALSALAGISDVSELLAVSGGGSGSFSGTSGAADSSGS